MESLLSLVNCHENLQIYSKIFTEKLYHLILMVLLDLRVFLHILRYLVYFCQNQSAMIVSIISQLILEIELNLFYLMGQKILGNA